MEHIPGNVTPTITSTQATSSSAEDNPVESSGLPPQMDNKPIASSPVSDGGTPSALSHTPAESPTIQTPTAGTLPKRIETSNSSSTSSTKNSSAGVNNVKASSPSVTSSSPVVDIGALSQVAKRGTSSPVVETGILSQFVKSGTSSPVVEDGTSSQGVKSGTSSPSVGDGTSSQSVKSGTSSQERDIPSRSDGPTSCSTPMSYDDSESDMHSARGYISRPLDLDLEASFSSSHTFMGSTQTFHSAITFLEPELKVPIVDYEVMEQRAKFTVFKLHVQYSEVDNWFIFRRYTDFVRLNDRLKISYPSFRLSLPPKRWFGSNFDPNFLEDRQLGLQAFLNNITGHKEVVQSESVREFFCLDDPPGAHDSLEESRALCESLEESVYNLRKDLADRDHQLARTKLQLAESRQRITALLSEAEKAGVQLSSSFTDVNSSSPSVGSESSAMDFQSRVEADQAVGPIEQPPRQEHRVKEPVSDIIHLSPERSTSILSSPNCNINNSTDYSVNTLTSQQLPPVTPDEASPPQTLESASHTPDESGDGKLLSTLASTAGIIPVT